MAHTWAHTARLASCALHTDYYNTHGLSKLDTLASSTAARSRLSARRHRALARAHHAFCCVSSEETSSRLAASASHLLGLAESASTRAPRE
eukprot:scaffold9998_cov63-Phaeocystis_antarctica.AAC.11